MIRWLRALAMYRMSLRPECSRTYTQPRRGQATIMLALSFVMLLFINLVQTWSRKRYG